LSKKAIEFMFYTFVHYQSPAFVKDAESGEFKILYTGDMHEFMVLTQISFKKWEKIKI